jgi:hypothetical protein
MEVRSNDEGKGWPPRHHHDPAPSTAAASNCSRGGWGALTDGDTRDERQDDGYDVMDTKRTTGSWSNGGNEPQGERTNSGNEGNGEGEGPERTSGYHDAGEECCPALPHAVSLTARWVFSF